MNRTTRSEAFHLYPARARAFIALVLLGLCLAACARETPQGLAKHLAAAYKAGDLNEAMTWFDLRDTPAIVQMMAIDTVSDCYGEFDCTVEAVPLSDEFKQDMAKINANPNREFAVQPLGLIEVKGFAHNTPGAKPEMTSTMPYGMVDGMYKIITERRTPQRNAQLREKSAQAVADEKLADGIGDPADKQWKSKATALPADAGAPGRVLADLVARRAAAYQTQDFAALIALGGLRAKILYRDHDASGKPRPVKLRQFTLRGQFLQDLADVKVLGGYVLDHTAAVIVDGRDGAGWIVRGVMLMEKKNGTWTESGRRTLEIPPG